MNEIINDEHSKFNGVYLHILEQSLSNSRGNIFLAFPMNHAIRLIIAVSFFHF